MGVNLRVFMAGHPKFRCEPALDACSRMSQVVFLFYFAWPRLIGNCTPTPLTRCHRKCNPRAKRVPLPLRGWMSRDIVFPAPHLNF